MGHPGLTTLSIPNPGSLPLLSHHRSSEAQDLALHVLPYTLCATEDPFVLVQIERGGLGFFGACFLETQFGQVGRLCPAQGPWLQGCSCVTVTNYLGHGRADTAWSKAGLTLFEPSLEMNE